MGSYFLLDPTHSTFHFPTTTKCQSKHELRHPTVFCSTLTPPTNNGVPQLWPPCSPYSSVSSSSPLASLPSSWQNSSPPSSPPEPSGQAPSAINGTKSPTTIPIASSPSTSRCSILLLRLTARRLYCSPTTPFSRFRLLPFRPPLLRESLLLSFPLATKMFQFARLSLACPWIQQQFERSDF
ncbi:hypothetical protein E3N88_00795 [Mikania micrantha]|uniref:Uncharacterized protein n=1 Tax=Mikania micrantha TaxID=192012 RepID=A0A5N6PZ56_9ASTR|nr:hypothetical protein E3N88_00795 [Mikania micrantha]